MLKEMYFKEMHDKNDTAVISFEGDVMDVYELRDYARIINSVQREVENEYYRGFNNDNTKREEDYGKADYEATEKTTFNDVDRIVEIWKEVLEELADYHDEIDEDEDADGRDYENELCDIVSDIMEEECETAEASDAVNKPSHYRAGKIETIEKIEAVINGLPAKQASCLANVLKYFDRAGLKDDAEQDLDKANNYAHRLVYGSWRYEH